MKDKNKAAVQNGKTVVILDTSKGTGGWTQRSPSEGDHSTKCGCLGRSWPRDALEGAQGALLSRLRSWDLRPQHALMGSLRVLPGAEISLCQRERILFL